MYIFKRIFILSFICLLYACKGDKTQKKSIIPETRDTIIVSIPEKQQLINITNSVIAKNGLFVRKQPESSGDIITKLPFASQVKIIEHTGKTLEIMDNDKQITGEWVKINFKLFEETSNQSIDQSGYVFNAFLSPRFDSRFKALKWGEIFCDFKAYFDNDMYSEQEIIDTFQFAFRDVEFSLYNYEKPFFWYNLGLETSYTASNLEELSRLSLDTLNEEYNRKYKYIQNLNLIDEEYWEKQRKRELSILKKSYDFYTIQIKAHFDPKILLTLDIPASKHEFCDVYIDRLVSGGQALIEYWDNFVEEQCQNNSNPYSCYERSMYGKGTEHEETYAKMYLIKWALGRCTKLDASRAYKEQTEMQEHFVSTLYGFEEDCAETD
ncbi:SH3 domain-containing protein [Aquimarina algiphila]|uniref:SH3 domain-containing protein n=1 Tax=Aquimarina algiphila TaxID=2047982 RepID=A0A554VBN5_9FLAO|nr:SH3 domain-containing protein [Aquimarina algiphila]TSE03969.1 SH3 domain-containing protein [Aquimarina algiphila]